MEFLLKHAEDVTALGIAVITEGGNISDDSIPREPREIEAQG